MSYSGNKLLADNPFMNYYPKKDSNHAKHVEPSGEKVVDEKKNRLGNAGNSALATPGNRKKETGREVAPADSIQAIGFNLSFSEESLLTGIIMSEVLGRPKCNRKGRW